MIYKHKTFVNFSNHPSFLWEIGQREAALEYGEIVDVPFPDVDPAGDEEYIHFLAEESIARIMEYSPAAVLCQGEFCLAYQVTSMLLEQEILVVAACSKRIVREERNRKEVVFEFRRFRRYQNP